MNPTKSPELNPADRNNSKSTGLSEACSLQPSHDDCHEQEEASQQRSPLNQPSRAASVRVARTISCCKLSTVLPCKCQGPCQAVQRQRGAQRDGRKGPREEASTLPMSPGFRQHGPPGTLCGQALGLPSTPPGHSLSQHMLEPWSSRGPGAVPGS